MRKIALGLALASTALATPALAKDKTWYVEGDAGGVIVESNPVANVTAGGTALGNIKSKPATTSAASSVMTSVPSVWKPKPAIVA
jgi:hypothetical protein